MAIAVTTPTGNVGSQLVRQLIQAGVRPVVLVRDPSRLDPQVVGYVDARVGDLADTQFVRQALRGVEALYLVIPEVVTAADPEADAEALADSVLAAVVFAGVGRVVLQSSVGAGKRSGVGFINALGRIEERLNALSQTSGIAVCHLRCSYLFSNLLMDQEGLRQGELRMAMPEDQAMPWVAPADVAAVAAGRLLSTEWSGRVVQSVHGPEDLTFPQVAEIVRRVTGWPVTYTRSSDDSEREGLRAGGFSEAAIESIIGMSAGLRGTYDPVRDRDLLSTTPTPLTGWVLQHLGRNPRTDGS